MRYVKCLFCENKRKRGDMFCVDCRALYGPYEREEWFSDLVAMERKQRSITKLESTNCDVDYLTKATEVHYGSSRKRGRPRTTDIIESYIRSIYKDDYSVRQLTKQCISSGLFVSRESVRSIINRIKMTKK